MSLKLLITATYGSSTYADTAKLQELCCKAATAKNQWTFLNRCIFHKIMPRFLQKKQPYKSRRIQNITDEYKKRLLIATRNDTKARFFQRSKDYKRLLETLKQELNEEHYQIIVQVTNSSKEKKFTETRAKLKKKFELLYEKKYRRPYITVAT